MKILSHFLTLCLWGFTQQIAKKIKNAIPCVRVGIAVVGLEVPHAHIHLIPLNTVEDMNFKNERLKLTGEEYTEIQNSIINS
jgi:histidine triad (HIT) family protein